MPKIVNYEERRRNIADVAIALFAEISFEAASMQKIADKAGIAKGSIYKYFKTKETLLSFIAESFLNEVHASLSQFDNTEIAPQERLRGVLMWVVNLIEEHQELFKVYTEIWTYNLRGSYGGLKELFERHLERYRDLSKDIIQQGQTCGTFKKSHSAEDLAIYLVASLDGLMLHYLYSDGRFKISRVAESFINSLLEGLQKNS